MPKFQSRVLVTTFLFATTFVSGCGQPVEDTRPGQPVKHRQVAFKEILKVFEPMGVMLRANEYNPDKFLDFANQVSVRKDAPWQYFLPDTNYPPTKAKSEVWTRTPEFEAERQKFLTAVTELQQAAQTRNKAESEKAYAKVYGLCDSCHKEFKLR